MKDSNEVVNQVISLYKTSGWKRWFSKIRFWDAPFVMVEKVIPDSGLIIDIGCGEGIFSNFMGLMSSKRKIIGLDLNRSRIKDADHGLSNVKFKYIDATKTKIPGCDTVVLFHLLHHLPTYYHQEMLINNCYKALRKNGRLVIVEVTERPVLKYMFSWAIDSTLVPILFERKLFDKDINYRKNKEWKTLLEKSGFKVKFKSLHQRTPFSHSLIIADK